MCFNTSHVTLYPILAIIRDTISESFNTSHVTLYPSYHCLYLSINTVSIHHMLLFISSAASNLEELRGFQYITCYSLSYLHCQPGEISGVSIHHMLLFISNPFQGSHRSQCVSIHHMLLFIPRFIGILSIHMSNNTPKPKEFQYFYQALLEILYF